MRKFAYKKIWKEGKTHQQVYDEILTLSNESPEEIALTLKSVPSPQKNQEKKSLWMIAALLFLGVAGLRSFALIVSPPEAMSDLGYVIPLVIFGIAMPLYGVYGATKGMIMAYGWMGITMITNVILVLAQTQYVSDSITYLTAIVAGLAMVSSGIVPRMLRVNYTRTVEEIESNGKTKKKAVFTFDN